MATIKQEIMFHQNIHPVEQHLVIFRLIDDGTLDIQQQHGSNLFVYSNTFVSLTPEQVKALRLWLLSPD